MMCSVRTEQHLRSEQVLNLMVFKSRVRQGHTGRFAENFGLFHRLAARCCLVTCFAEQVDTEI